MSVPCYISISARCKAGHAAGAESSNLAASISPAHSALISLFEDVEVEPVAVFDTAHREFINHRS